MGVWLRVIKRENVEWAVNVLLSKVLAQDMMKYVAELSRGSSSYDIMFISIAN